MKDTGVKISAVGLVFCLILLFYLGFSALGEGAGFKIFSEFLDQTRLHFTVLFAPLFLVFILRREWAAAFMVAVTLLVNSLIIVSAYGGSGLDKGGGGRSEGLRVLSLNVNIENNDVDGIRDLIISSGADFVLVLEANPRLGAALQSALAEHYPYHTIRNTSELKRGFIGLSRYELGREASYVTMGDSRQRLLFSTVSFKGNDIGIYGVHLLSPIGQGATPGERIAVRDHQLILLARHIGSSSGNTPFIIAGDMNSVPWQKNMLEMKRLLEVNNSHRVRDMSSTWPAWLPKFMGISIDHIYYSRGLCRSRGGVLEIPGSDHRAVYADLEVCG